jgi:hypothetical protein
MNTMKNLVLPAAAVLCLSVSGLSVSTFAQTAPTTPQTTKAAAKVKPIKFTVVNTTNGPIALRNGDQDVTLKAGQSQQLQSAEGTKLTTTAPSAAGDTGTVVVQVSSGMNGVTVNLR